ncbi:MAG: hypothetical protein NZ893_02665 [Candidatus Aenigmarchaeota archaeon]|nr:hypothetical protein [Candidatus Aenigmarchaeota archaeon]
MELLLAFLGNAFLYAFLSWILPEKFAPLKIAYLLLTFFCIWGMFGSVEITDRLINVTFNPITNTTTKIVTFQQKENVVNLASYALYMNFIAFGITVAYIVIVLIIESLKPTQKIIEKVENYE